MLTVIETCRISLPPGTVGDKTLPLTFFDLQWLPIPQIHQLFFYDFPYPQSHFTETVVPRLKHSLSITLQHFFPFAGNLIVFPTNDHSNLPRKPEIRHEEGDSIPFTVAESTLDFDYLTGDHPRQCDKFYHLIPLLDRAVKVSDHVKIPIFSVQVTCFPNSGFSIAITNNHVLCDASSKFDFLKAWAWITKSGNDDSFLAEGWLPVYDRVIKYPDSIDEIFLKETGAGSLNEDYQPPKLVGHTDKVRATFVLTRTNVSKLKKCVSIHVPNLEYVSSFSVTCAYVWSCLAKSRANVGENANDDGLEIFIGAANLRARLDPPIPQTYFGNCVMPCFATTRTSLLSGEKGFLIAAELVGESIREAVNKKNEVFKDAETWFGKFKAKAKKTGIAGTPKVKIYDTDFGWGKPRKYETISTDYTGAVSMNASKESSDDIEIGMSLAVKQMDAFGTIFAAGLEKEW